MSKKEALNEQTNNRIISVMEMKNPKIKALYALIYSFIVILCICAAVPILWTVVSATKDIDEFYRIPPTIIPQSFHPEKFLEAWKKFSFTKYYLNTAVIALGYVVFSIICNGLMAYSLSRLKPKGYKLILTIFMWTMMVPGSLAAQMKNIVNFPILHINLINTPWPLWIMAAGGPFTVIWFKGYFDTIPSSIVESAKLDGASNITIFMKIIMPIAKPIILTQAIMTFNSAWQDYFWPMILLKEKDIQTIMARVLAIQGSLAVDEQMVMLTLVMIPPIIFFIIIQKHLVGNMNEGGVKG